MGIQQLSGTFAVSSAVRVFLQYKQSFAKYLAMALTTDSSDELIMQVLSKYIYFCEYATLDPYFCYPVSVRPVLLSILFICNCCYICVIACN